MDAFILPFLVFTISIGIISFLIHFYSSRFWVRVVGLIIFISSLPAGWYLVSNQLSKPKPVSLAFFDPSYRSQIQILSVSSIPNTAIFVWVIVKGENFPRSYQLPWSAPLEKSMRRKMEEVVERKGKWIAKNLKSLFLGNYYSPGRNIIVDSLPPKEPPKRKTLIDRKTGIDVFNENRETP